MRVLDLLERGGPRRSRLGEGAIAALVGAQARLRGVRFVAEGELPPGPAVLATNSTARYDFVALRWVLRQAGRGACSLTKAKYYHHRVEGTILPVLGTIPLVSRGYLIAAGFRELRGRLPSEDEYRALRTWVDGGPAVAGLPERWARSVVARYEDAMRHAVRWARQAADRGDHVHIYPEGTVQPWLGPGRVGAVQLARALDLPLVPVGMSGCPDVFRGLRLHPGEVRVRFGTPVPLGALQSFTAFETASEARHRQVLTEDTARLMEAIDGLLEARWRRRGVAPAGKGVRGFL